jgi:hypothetical protein
MKASPLGKFFTGTNRIQISRRWFPKTQHFMAERMGAKIHSHRVDHTPMYADPNVVVDVILEAARGSLPS